MVKVSYDLWKRSFPYICNECGYLLHENAKICQYCGKPDSLRKITKKDYKSKFKKMKEL